MKIRLNELLYEVSFALDCVEHDLVGATTNHSKRVAWLSLAIGRAMGLEQAQLADLSCCAALHDNALTEYILSERMNGVRVTGTAAGRRRISLREHCVLGEKNGDDFPFLSDVRGVILYHHENPDGSGCFGKRAEEIPLGAAIIRLADNVDVLYNLGRIDASLLSAVRAHVRQNTGRLYDARVAQAFLSVPERELYAALPDAALSDALREQTPAVTQRCDNQQLLRIASVFTHIIDYKSPFTRRHSSGIAARTYAMANYYGLSEPEKTPLTLAAALHDIGKLAVSTELLEKPGRLTDEEFTEIKSHALYTYRILGGISGFETITRWAAGHHEKLNGRGYPFGLQDDEIDFQMRLLGCIDIYQALTEERPYRAGMPHEEAMAILSDMVRAGELDGDITADVGRVMRSPAYAPAPCG